MIYVFDNSPLSALFRNYYRNRFPSLWANFDAIVDEGRLLSTREAMRELEDGPSEDLRDWCKANNELFATPSADEGRYVSKIYGVPHFQQNIEQQKILRGGRNADPFVIARAAILGGTVVTMEKLKPNGVKIPNICDHFSIPCMSLEDFMENEDWTF